MRDYTDEMIEGIRILRYILRPEKVVIAVEDNKPEATGYSTITTWCKMTLNCALFRLNIHPVQPNS